MTEQEFIDALAEKGITLTETQVKQFKEYFHLLVEWNEKMNLTAITDVQGVYLKHFYDSIMPLWHVQLEQDAHLCDVGAGAGFPSIPMKIIRPDLHITIIDSLNKRIHFLNHLSQALQLENVQAIHARAEEAGQDPTLRGKFDYVTARAVASLNVLCEFCLPFIKKGGYFIALKGHQADHEIEAATNAIKILGAKFESQALEKLPLEESDRAIISIRKTLETPKKYPRRAGKPSKQPIV